MRCQFLFHLVVELPLQVVAECQEPLVLPEDLAGPLLGWALLLLRAEPVLVVLADKGEQQS